MNHLIKHVLHALSKQRAGLDVLDEAPDVCTFLPLLFGYLLALPLLYLLLGAVPELSTHVVQKAHITLAA